MVITSGFSYITRIMVITTLYPITDQNYWHHYNHPEVITKTRRMYENPEVITVMRLIYDNPEVFTMTRGIKIRRLSPCYLPQKLHTAYQGYVKYVPSSSILGLNVNKN